MSLTLTSSAFTEGEILPRLYTADGKDVSPPLEWTGAPEWTREFAIICDDPDAPTEQPWVHWVLYGIPASVTSLPEGKVGQSLTETIHGMKEGRNTFGNLNYGGPAPPAGHGVHHYHFKLFALDEPTQLTSGATKRDLLTALEEHVLDQTELTGLYIRPGVEE